MIVQPDITLLNKNFISFQKAKEYLDTTFKCETYDHMYFSHIFTCRQAYDALLLANYLRVSTSRGDLLFASGNLTSWRQVFIHLLGDSSPLVELTQQLSKLVKEFEPYLLDCSIQRVSDYIIIRKK